jgi:hypothetical protein
VVWASWRRGEVWRRDGELVTERLEGAVTCRRALAWFPLSLSTVSAFTVRDDIASITQKVHKAYLA